LEPGRLPPLKIGRSLGWMEVKEVAPGTLGESRKKQKKQRMFMDDVLRIFQGGLIKMTILFPIAGVHLSMYLILGLGCLVGFLSGLFGVGGGFIMTPLLMMLGVPPAVAAASDNNQIVGASVSGALGHARLGNVDWKLGLLLVAGGLTGGWLGTQLVHQLRAVGNYNYAVQVIYIVMLLLVGCYMFNESVRAVFQKEGAGKGKAGTPLLGRLPGLVSFQAAGIEASVYGLVGLGLLVGLLAALLGVGGGFIMLPVLIYLIGVPTAVAVGTSLVTVLFTCVEVTFMHSVVNHSVDLLLALVLLLGSSVGAQIGVRVCRLLKGEQLRAIFALIVLATMGKMARDLLVPGAAHGTGGAGGTAQVTGPFAHYVTALAANQPALYGAVAVIIALAAGVGINYVFTAVDSLLRSASQRLASAGHRGATGLNQAGGLRSLVAAPRSNER